MKRRAATLTRDIVIIIWVPSGQRLILEASGNTDIVEKSCQVGRDCSMQMAVMPSGKYHRARSSLEFMGKQVG